VEVRVNGALVYQTTTASLTTAGAQTLQIGCNTASQPFTLFADNIAVTTAAVSQATPTATTPAATATTPAATATTPAATATSPAATATSPAATATSPATTATSPATTATATAKATATAAATAVTATSTPSPTPAAGSTLFSDGFESGNFAAWSAVQTGADGVATVQSVTVKSGSYAAQLSASAAAGSYAYAREALATAQTDLTASGDFQVTAEGPSGNNVPLLKLMDPSGATLAVLFRQNQSNNQLWLKHSGGYYQTSGTLPLNTWAHLELHVIAAGSGASTVEVRVNGALVYQTTTASLTTAGAQTLQIGCSTASQPFTLFADNITIA